MNFKVFIDGAEGTTGLKIHEYFRQREDIQVLDIPQELRKDPQARLQRIDEADITFLCLPDAAARQIAYLAPASARIIDTSTAHRTASDWVYGLPELHPGQRQLIRESNRVANPGCHATGVITLVRPLVDAGLLPTDTPLTVTSLTGYSGGGKKMIAAYEDPQRKQQAADPRSVDPRRSPGQYGISQSHKHIPEILQMTGLTVKPSFLPVVADYYSGMEVILALSVSQLTWRGQSPGSTPGQILEEVYREHYAGEQMITVTDADDAAGFIYGNRLAGTNLLQISVHGDGENLVLTATFDNLGKGASGAAVQNMNLMLGIEETKGLR